LVIVFGAGLGDPAAVLDGVAEIASGIPVIGCSSTAAICAHGPLSSGVAVVALGGSGFGATAGLGRGAASSGQRAAGAAAAACIGDLPPREHTALLLLADGSALTHEKALYGAYSTVGATVPIVGGAVSPDDAFGGSFQLYGREVVTDGVVAAAIASDGPLGVAVGHGWSKVTGPMIVTHAVGSRIHSIDGRPARSEYLDRLQGPPDTYKDPDAFRAFAAVRPIGLRRRSGPEIREVGSIRFPFDRDHDILVSGGEIPTGSVIWLMEGDATSGVMAADRTCQKAVEALGGHIPLGAIAFDCSTRRELCGAEGTIGAICEIVKETEGAPIAGGYVWGEYARRPGNGVNGYYNQSLAVLAAG
jgi:hypothetical protein